MAGSVQRGAALRGSRLIGMVTIVVGLSTFAVVTAKIGEFLVRTRPAA